MNAQEPVENFQQLYNDLKKYVELQTDYVKVEFVEKMTILVSTLLIIILVVVFVIAALFYLFFSLAYILLPLVGSLAISFGIISGIYFILIGLLMLFRKRLIVNPLVRFLSKLFLTKTNL
jgi:hypothetical protein